MSVILSLFINLHDAEADIANTQWQDMWRRGWDGLLSNMELSRQLIVGFDYGLGVAQCLLYFMIDKLFKL